MNTRRILLFLVLLCAPSIVFSQESATTSTATSTLDAVASTPDWYTVDRIAGRVDVGDFVVGPGRTEVSVEPGETVVRYIMVTNRVSEERTFKLQVEDITGTADGSSVLQVLEGERGPYSIRDYISFPEDTITLALGERAKIPVTISVPGDAEPGGFYGSILVSTVRLGTVGESETPQSPVIARVGSHIFLTVPGEQEIGGEVLGLSIIPEQWWYESGPFNFGIAYENTGSIHVNPYGELSVTNLFGDEVGYVELDPWFVLPRSIRTREIVWDREFLFGRYTAKATINRGYNDVLDEVAVTFWVLPWKLLLLMFGSVFITIFIIRFFIKNFEFKRRS